MRIAFPMWAEALRSMPRVSRDQWDGLDLVSRWLVSTRAAALVMSIISAAIGGILALREGPTRLWLWPIVCFGLVMAHGTNNLINDLVDFRRGVDRANYFRDLYGPQPLERGYLSESRHRIYIVITGLLALGAGVVLGLLTGPLTWVLLGIGAFFLLFYTWPLKYIALGEISLLIVWGPLMIGGTYAVLTGTWSWLAVLAGLPFALSVSATLVGKHLDKREMDREKLIMTLPVVLGDAASRVLVMVMIALQFGVLLLLMALRYFSPLMLLPFLSLAFLFKSVVPMFRSPRPIARPQGYPETAWPLWFVASTFVFSRRFGAWYLLALVADTGLRAVSSAAGWTLFR